MKIFTYGTLMKNGGRNDIIQKACGIFLDEVETLEKYYMGEQSCYPFLLETSVQAKETIFGELYEVPDDFVEIIDDYEGVPSLFYKSKIKVRNDIGRVHLAYCYFLKD